MTVAAATDELELENLEIDLLLSAIATRYGYEFRNYGRGSMRRRIRRAVQVLGVKTISALQEKLLHHPDDLGTFISIVSVHVTSMFRDPPFYVALRKLVVPQLRTHPFVRIWHAGCATGEEVYSLAILLEEEGLYDRCRIYATDIADRVLAQAERGIYPLQAIEESAGAYQRAGGKRDFSSFYRTDEKHAAFTASLRRNLVFSQHNLVSDASFNEFQLILCRNVLIYFNQTLRRRVHELLYQSLTRFGALGLGTRETLRFSPFEERYESLDREMRI
jgi:chemotaxis protein methyltransferase CheR